MFDNAHAVLSVLGGFKGDKENRTHRIHSLATTNATLVRAGVTTLGRISLYNLGTAFRFLKLYDKATAPNPATDVPIRVIPLPPDGGFHAEFKPVNFAVGLGYVLVAGAADTDATAIAANEVTGELGYAQ